jgi:hypothetical protein
MPQLQHDKIIDKVLKHLIMAEPKIVQPKINAELIYYQLTEIKSELGDIKKGYVTKTESQALKAEIAGLREELRQSNDETKDQIGALKRKSAFQSFLYPTLSAGFTAVFTYLLIEALQNK